MAFDYDELGFCNDVFSDPSRSLLSRLPRELFIIIQPLLYATTSGSVISSPNLWGMASLSSRCSSLDGQSIRLRLRRSTLKSWIQPWFATTRSVKGPHRRVRGR